MPFFPIVFQCVRFIVYAGFHNCQTVDWLKGACFLSWCFWVKIVIYTRTVNQMPALRMKSKPGKASLREANGLCVCPKSCKVSKKSCSDFSTTQQTAEYDFSSLGFSTGTQSQSFVFYSLAVLLLTAWSLSLFLLFLVKCPQVKISGESLITLLITAFCSFSFLSQLKSNLVEIVLYLFYRLHCVYSIDEK